MFGHVIAHVTPPVCDRMKRAVSHRTYQPAPHDIKPKEGKKRKLSLASVVKVPPPPSTQAEESHLPILPFTSSAAFQADILPYLHTNIVQFGLTRPMDLLRWHSTHRARYAEWCREDYLVLLCEMARERSVHLYALGRQARHFADVQRFSCMVMTVALSEWLFRTLVPTKCTLDDEFHLDWPYTSRGGSKNTYTLKEALTVVGYNGPMDLSDIGSESTVEWVLTKVMLYLSLRYGWDLVLDNGQRTNTNPAKANWSDVVGVRLAECVRD
jgi:hypothetical protein